MIEIVRCIKSCNIINWYVFTDNYCLWKLNMFLKMTKAKTKCLPEHKVNLLDLLRKQNYYFTVCSMKYFFVFLICYMILE